MSKAIDEIAYRREQAIECTARKFAATIIKDKNKQPDNDIFFAAIDGFKMGAEWMKQNAINIVCPILANCDVEPEDVIYLEKQMKKFL